MYILMAKNKRIEPDKYTFTFVLKVCIGLSSFEKGVKIHEEVFDKMPERDVVVWNAMISGFAQCGRAVKAVELFKKIQIVCEISPSSVTLLNLVPAVCRLRDV
ncbi:hypothetical protein BC332_12423 [Capsicum chinense]|nr:hypothetical protein BC332_12423 [Capsicum chinense]